MTATSSGCQQGYNQRLASKHGFRREIPILEKKKNIQDYLKLGKSTNKVPGCCVSPTLL